MIVLDTNVVSELMHPRGSLVVRQWVAAQPITNLFTTTITQVEILYGLVVKICTDMAKMCKLSCEFFN